MEPELLKGTIPMHFCVKPAASSQSCRTIGNQNLSKFMDIKKELQKSHFGFRGFTLEAKPKFTCIFAESNRCPTDAKRYKLTG